MICMEGTEKKWQKISNLEKGIWISVVGDMGDGTEGKNLIANIFGRRWVVFAEGG